MAGAVAAAPGGAAAKALDGSSAPMRPIFGFSSCGARSRIYAMRSLRSSSLHPNLGHLDRRISRRGFAAAPLGSGRRGNRRWLSHEGRLPESAHLRPLAIFRTSDCLRKPATAKTLPFLIQITPAPAPVLSPSATPGTPCTVTLLEVAYWMGTGISSVVEGSPIARSEAASCGEMPGIERM